MGRRRVLLMGGMALLLPPLAYAYVSQSATSGLFGLVVICYGLSAIVTGLIAPAGYAFQADCLPRGHTGQPSDPARDTAGITP